MKHNEEGHIVMMLRIVKDKLGLVGCMAIEKQHTVGP
jgi:hypothetical protein